MFIVHKDSQDPATIDVHLDQLGMDKPPNENEIVLEIDSDLQDLRGLLVIESTD